MSEAVLEKLFAAVRQYWPQSQLLTRPDPYWPDEIQVYWFVTKPQSNHLVRIFSKSGDSSFIMTSYHCPDPDIHQQFKSEYKRSGVDFLMLPYAVQGMNVTVTPEGAFLVNSIKVETTYKTKLRANEGELMLYANNGFR